MDELGGFVLPEHLHSELDRFRGKGWVPIGPPVEIAFSDATLEDVARERGVVLRDRPDEDAQEDARARAFLKSFRGLG